MRRNRSLVAGVAARRPGRRRLRIFEAGDWKIEIGLSGGFKKDESGKIISAGKYTPFGHTDYQQIVAEIKQFAAGGKACVINTLNGDTTLDGKVDIFALNALLPHFNGPGGWTRGDSTYNGTFDIFDLNSILPNFNTTLPSVSPASATVSATAPVAPSSTPISPQPIWTLPAPPTSPSLTDWTIRRSKKGTKKLH